MVPVGFERNVNELWEIDIVAEKQKFWSKKEFHFVASIAVFVLIASAVSFAIGYDQGKQSGKKEGIEERNSWFVNMPYYALGKDKGQDAIKTIDELSSVAETHMDDKFKSLSKSTFGDDVDLGFAVLKCWSEIEESAIAEKERNSIRSSR